MLGKKEVYTFRRISNPAINNPRVKHRGQLKFDWNILPKKWNYRTFFYSLRSAITVKNLIFGVIAFILARSFILGELLPFVYGFVAAFGLRDRNCSLLLALFSLGGLATVLGGMDLWSNIITLITLTGIIANLNLSREKSWWGVPLLTVSAIILVKGVLLVLGTFSFYDGMVIVFESIIAGVLAFVFMVASETIKQKKPLPEFVFEEITAFVVIGIGIVMGLIGIEVAGLSISGILCRVGILVAAFLWGSGGGTMVGVMAGIIPSVSSSTFTQVLGMFAFSGLLAGLFRNMGRIGVIIGFMLGNLALSMFLSETQATILGIWETAVACLIFSLLPSSIKEKMPVQSMGGFSLKDEDIQDQEHNIDIAARRRIENLAEVLDELSCTFIHEASSNAKSSPITYINYLCDEISNGFCVGCIKHEKCWGKDGSNICDEILEVFSRVDQSGSLSYEECPINFKNRCINGRELINTINFLFDNLRLNHYWFQKYNDSRKLISRQLKGMSHIIKNLAKEIDIKPAVDMELGSRLIHETRRRGIELKSIIPYRCNREQSYINIVADSCPDSEQDKCSEVAQTISLIMGQKMEINEKKCSRFTGAGQCEFTLGRAFNYRVRSGAVQIGKEAICGDSYIISTLKEGKVLVALSDGMGVGEKAYLESNAAVRLLENLLNCGFEKEFALSTINSVLLLRSTAETFATLDVIMIDLYNAGVNFVKIGAAPSFIKRGKDVGIIKSNSLPIGILDNLDLVSEQRVLAPKDVLVMVSDGVLELSLQNGGENWIVDCLSRINDTDPQVIAEKLMNQALTFCRGEPVDDMTVICMVLDLAPVKRSQYA
jgi:stage II sporulation protein E